VIRTEKRTRSLCHKW